MRFRNKNNRLNQDNGRLIDQMGNTLSDRGLKLAKAENLLRSQLRDNNEEVISRILARLEGVNTNNLSHEVNETIRIRNLMR